MTRDDWNAYGFLRMIRDKKGCLEMTRDDWDD